MTSAEVAEERPSPPPLPQQEDDPAHKWKLLRFVGGLLAMGPLWGMILTFLEIRDAFIAISISMGAPAELLYLFIRDALYHTLYGILILPFGMGLILFTNKKLRDLESTAC